MKTDNTLPVLIVNYNTTDLIVANIKSVVKTTPDVFFYIFDNSDKERLSRETLDELKIDYERLDNTKGQLIDFAKELPFGSVRHTLSIDYCFDLISKPFVLLDSDVIVKKNLRELVDEESIFVGTYQPGRPGGPSHDRVQPYCCYINLPMCKENGIRFYYKNYSRDSKPWYDIGGAFYLFAKNFPHRFIVIDDYINHLIGGSWRNSDKETFLKENLINTMDV